MQTPSVPQVCNVTLTCRIVLVQGAVKTLKQGKQTGVIWGKICHHYGNLNDCGGCNRNKREGNRERAECCSNSVAQSAPVHIFLRSHVLVLQQPWCFVLLSCPLQVPRQMLQEPAAVPTDEDVPRLLSEQAEALLVPGWWRWLAAGFCLQPHSVSTSPRLVLLLETLIPLEQAVCSGLPEDETLFLCSKNVEDVDDFSSDKFQQSASVVLKTCQVFHTLITNAFEEYHTQANFSVMSFPLSSGEEPWGQRGQKSVFVFWALLSISTVLYDRKHVWRHDQWECAGKAGLQPCAGASQASVCHCCLLVYSQVLSLLRHVPCVHTEMEVVLSEGSRQMPCLSTSRPKSHSDKSLVSTQEGLFPFLRLDFPLHMAAVLAQPLPALALTSAGLFVYELLYGSQGCRMFLTTPL